MALSLNNYQTITGIVTTGSVGIYTAPTGYSAIILIAQATNLSTTETHTFNFTHSRTDETLLVTNTEMLQGFPLPSNDSASLLSGKLVLESGDSLVVSSSSDTDVKFISSVLETLNQ